MRINELKIYGFKSFANKTTIRFDDNFVGIVGPNGSGKSNIIDAVRWVFGEQSSKSLRGNSSVDVIFNGTEKRKRLNFAEVTLVLDNSLRELPLDYSEVSITRRLYRSGESDYLINGVDCRLRDISELLMDTGMGKSSFSIISQGKIEEIVVSKPENRRLVIEEVAGVLKYKKRKEVALRKLKKTDDNLSQVDLILSEMSDRLGPLQKQSTKALEYLQLKESLEVKEITYLSNKIHGSRDDYDAYKIIHDKLNSESITKKTELSTLEARQLELDSLSRNINIELNQKIVGLTQLHTKISSLEADFKILQERKVNNSKDEAQSKLLLLQKEIVELSTKIKDQESLVKVKQNDFDVTKKEFDKIENKIDFLRRNKYKLSEKVNEMRHQVESNSYPFAVKKILDNPEFDKSKVVKDIFTTDSKYMEAISAGLGGRINEVVMPNLSVIKRAIKYLRENKIGRVTFLPINDVKTYKIEDKLLSICKNQEGYIGLAYELIQFNDKFNYIFNNLLGTTIVVDTIDNGNNLSKKIHARYRVITLTGEIISTGGSVTGGQSKRLNPLLAQKNLDDLEKELSNTNANYKNLTQQIQNIEQKYHDARIELNIVNNELSDLTAQKKLKDYELSSSDNQFTEVVNEFSDIQQDIRDLHNRYALLEKAKLEKQNQVKIYDDEKYNISITLRSCNEDIREIDKQLNDSFVKMSRLENIIQSAQEILTEEYALTYESAYLKSDKMIDVEVAEKEVKDIKRKIKILGIVNIDAIEEFNEIKNRYDFIDTQKNDLNLAKDKLIGIINKLDHIVLAQFELVYTKLRAEFKIIFKELFGGGQSDLVLTDPNDLLNTGIEIVAQPPGKKLQTISLLSGGEKALTAISLLFAILRIRTVPFAILDEVEAALDEANVRRYANYIRVFSEKTQFLVITHRQGTMELVDNLYGITMVERGISSVVQIKMEGQEVNDV